MSTSTHLLLPYVLAAQAQKHVTVNEALRLLDGLVQLAVLDRHLTAPPASPADGDRHIVAAGATGAWAGWDGSVAYWVDGAWMRPLVDALGLIALGASVVVAEGPAGSGTSVAVAEELLSLSGASVDSTITIPDRAIVLGVSTRTVTAVTGATSYDCGIAGEAAKFGGSLGIAAGSSNAGVIGPTAFYAPTPIRLTANGGSFTGGSVRIAIHTLLPRVPQS